MLDEATQKKIASMADFSSLPATGPKDDSVWSALSREAYVLGGGVGDGFKANMNAQSMIERTPDFVISAGIGAGLALAQGKKGIVKLGAQITGLSFAAGFAKDLTDADRLNGLSTAVSNTWKSPDNLEQNRALVKKHAGDFAFDTTLMMAGGMLGAGSVKVGRSEAAGQLKSVVGNSLESVKRSLTPGTAGKAEVMSGALGAAERKLVGAVKENPGSSSAATMVERKPAVTEGGSISLSTGPREGHLPALEVIPEGSMTPNRGSRRLPDDAAQRPLADIQKTETLPWEMENGATATWKTSKEGVDVRLQAQQWVDAFTQGRYGDALKVAIEAPVMANVNLNPVKRPHTEIINAAELKRPDILQWKMSTLSSHAEFKWQQTMRDGQVEAVKLEVVIPKPIIELKEGTRVPLVDFVRNESTGKYSVDYPEKSVSGARLTPAEVSEIRAVRQSPEGQRLLAETAIFGFEETIVHANQHIVQSGKATSPTFAEFAAEWASQSPSLRGHRLSFLGALDNQHPSRHTIFEQEVPMLAYDAGMPLALVRHHFYFGDRHVNIRKPVMDFLRIREQSAI